MRTVLNIAVLVLSFETFLGSSPNATNIRRVDFKNFSYAWSEEMGDSSSVPSLYRWITPPSVNIRVANGIHQFYPRNRDALEGIYPKRSLAGKGATAPLEPDPINTALLRPTF